MSVLRLERYFLIVTILEVRGCITGIVGTLGLWVSHASMVASNDAFRPMRSTQEFLRHAIERAWPRCQNNHIGSPCRESRFGKFAQMNRDSTAKIISPYSADDQQLSIFGTAACNFCAEVRVAPPAEVVCVFSALELRE